MKRITAKHLERFHDGLSTAEYTKIYGETVPAKEAKLELALQHNERAVTIMADAVTREIVENDELMASVVKKVGDGIFSQEIKAKLSDACVVVLASAMGEVSKASTDLDGINAELNQDWRKTQAGENGTPTTNFDLVKMGELAQKRKTEAMKAIVDITKVAQASEYIKAQPQQIGIHVYSGVFDKKAIPSSMGSQQREKARLWLSRIAPKQHGTVAELIAKARKEDEIAEAEFTVKETVPIKMEDEPRSEQPA
jgi:hypothetical protein